MATNSLQQQDDNFEIFRHDAYMAFGIMKIADFEKIQVSLQSDLHPTWKRQLSGTWSSTDFKWLPPSEELFKVVARQKVNDILEKRERDYNKSKYDSEVE